jgi:hypothetical protein
MTKGTRSGKWERSSGQARPCFLFTSSFPGSSGPRQQGAGESPRAASRLAEAGADGGRVRTVRYKLSLRVSKAKSVVNWPGYFSFFAHPEVVENVGP